MEYVYFCLAKTKTLSDKKIQRKKFNNIFLNNTQTKDFPPEIHNFFEFIHMNPFQTII